MAHIEASVPRMTTSKNQNILTCTFCKFTATTSYERAQNRVSTAQLKIFLALSSTWSRFGLWLSVRLNMASTIRSSMLASVDNPNHYLGRATSWYHSKSWWYSCLSTTDTVASTTNVLLYAVVRRWGHDITTWLRSACQVLLEDKRERGNEIRPVNEEWRTSGSVLDDCHEELSLLV